MFVLIKCTGILLDTKKLCDTKGMYRVYYTRIA